MKNKLLIIGAGGHGKVIADIAIKAKKWEKVEFLDDNVSDCMCMGLEVIGNLSDSLLYINEVDFIVAIGNNSIREKLLSELENKGASIATLIHPSAVIGADVVVGIGTVVMAGAIINSSTKIGKGCIINTSCSIDHDNTIDDFVHISPGANLAGTVEVGRGSWIGIGSIVSNNIKICSDCTIGAAALVIKDITEPGTYIGVPVRRIKGK